MSTFGLKLQRNHTRPVYHIIFQLFRGNVVEPLSRILEPVLVRHLDIDSPVISPKKSKHEPSKNKDVVPRRQMASQLVRLGSIDKDPGVIGPLVWDLHCQRIKDGRLFFSEFD